MAPVMTRSGDPPSRVVRPCPIDSRITLPPPKTASSPARPGPPQRAAVISISRSVSASRTRSPTVGPYRAAYRSRDKGSGIERAADLAAETADVAIAGQCHQFHLAADPRFETHAGPRRDAQAVTPGGR